jgi:hypothetical protein
VESGCVQELILSKDVKATQTHKVYIYSKRQASIQGRRMSERAEEDGESGSQQASKNSSPLPGGVLGSHKKVDEELHEQEEESASASPSFSSSHCSHDAYDSVGQASDIDLDAVEAAHSLKSLTEEQLAEMLNARAVASAARHEIHAQKYAPLLGVPSFADLACTCLLLGGDKHLPNAYHRVLY